MGPIYGILIVMHFFDSCCKSWNIAVRTLYRIDRRTHTRYLHGISNSPTLKVTLGNRYKQFINIIRNSCNSIIINTSSFALSDARYTTFMNLSYANNVTDNSLENNLTITNQIREFIDVREGISSLPLDLDNDEIINILYFLCTS